jgi:hypothetical protein
VLIVESEVAMLPAALTAPFAPCPAASSTAFCSVSTSLVIWDASWSIASFAFWPASVFGLPRPFRSSAKVFVAALISLELFFRSPSDRLP